MQPFHVLLRADPYAHSKHDLRKAFHESSIRFHPDKIGQRNSEEFHRLRTAYDILLNKRQSWAYRRIGPDVATNPLYARCSTKEDFRKAAMESAIQSALTPSSVLTLASSVVFMKDNSFVVRTSPTFQRRYIPHHIRIQADHKLCNLQFWSNALLNTLSKAFEFAIFIFPEVLQHMRLWFPNFLPFQVVQLFRRATLTVSCAIWSLTRNQSG
jgi:hypothetical protein